MSATSLTLRGRAAAEAKMLDAVTVQRPNPATDTTDPDTGVFVPGFTSIYTGKAKIQQQAASASPTPLGEAQVFIAQVEVHLPISATGIRADDLVTVTASVLDADLVGRKFKVRGTAHKSYLTARRLAVIEVTG